MKQPNFLCIGAQKTGTTTLHEILKDHPDIFLPEQKETHFFNREAIYSNGFEWYLKEHFDTVNEQKAIGEFNPDLLYFEKAPERIAEHLGRNIKLIVILRNPVDRGFSQYLMAKTTGFETESFETAINLEKERLNKGEHEHTYYSYFNRGRYSEQLRRYLNHFDRNNILLLSFEHDIRNNLPKTVERIQRFIGVEPIELNHDIQKLPSRIVRNQWLQNNVHQPSTWKSALKKLIPPAQRRALIERMNKINSRGIQQEDKLNAEEKEHYFQTHFDSEIEALKSLIGIDYSYWLEAFKK